jgi:hypothetical protein
MLLKKFFKQNFISFYKDENYNVLLETIKNKQTLFSETKNFEEKKDLEKFIEECIDDNPQTYISYLSLSVNQGVVDSCSKQKYKELGIELGNIKLLCIDNKYSFYASIYDVTTQLKKEYNFDIDFVYPPFAIIDYIAKERKNIFYILVFKHNIIVMGYENEVPKFGDVNPLLEEDETDEEEDDDVAIVEDLTEDLEEDLDDDLDDIEEIEDIDEIEDVSDASITTHLEMELLNITKDALKDYYEKYSDEFIEKIIILDACGIDKKIKDIVENELIIPTEYQKIDVLKIMNRISIEIL